jgi:AcrR family transcriptional regulator
MGKIKTAPASAVRGEPVRRRVLDAAERLLRQGKADFSMRDLASEAGVSFATPFNHFGSKAAIMHALSARRIDTMLERFAALAPPRDTIVSVLKAVDVAVEVMLEEPLVNRAVMSWIGTAGPSPGRVLQHSMALWCLALEEGERPWPPKPEGGTDRDRLPQQLAFAFRGVLSFWTAGEIADEEMASYAREVATSLLLRFVERE